MSRFAVAVAGPDMGLEVLEEVAVQRGLSVPVFVTKSDLVMGQSFRIVFIENGRAVETMTDATPATLDAAATRLLGTPAVTPSRASRN